MGLENIISKSSFSRPSGRLASRVFVRLCLKGLQDSPQNSCRFSSFDYNIGPPVRESLWPNLRSGKLHSKATSRALPRAWSVWNTSQDLLVDSHPISILQIGMGTTSQWQASQGKNEWWIDYVKRHRCHRDATYDHAPKILWTGAAVPLSR